MTTGEIRCLEDMDRFGAETDDELEDLTQDLYHRLIEAPGSNIDDPARGLGIEGRLSGSARSGTVSSSLEYDIDAEMRKDHRVLGVRPTVTETAPGEYGIAIEIQANQGAFTLRLLFDAGGLRLVAA